MPKFGDASTERLSTCHPDLQLLCHIVIKWMDFAVLCGTRDEASQTAAFNAGLSKLKYPQSKHNGEPSLAVDLVPYPVKLSGISVWDGKGQVRFYLMAGMFWAAAKLKGIKIRWGGDWNGNLDPHDQNFLDLPHIELVDPRPADIAMQDLNKYLEAA